MPNNKRWRITISGTGDESTAVTQVKDTVKRFRDKGQKLTEARFVLLPADDTRESHERSEKGSMDILADYGERSVPSQEFGGEESSARS